jgi:hypothetical protein
MGGSLEEDAVPPRLLREEGDIPDPFGGDLQRYADTRDVLSLCARELVSAL